MKIIKPKNKKYLRELYFNPLLALVFIVLFLLNFFDLLVISTNFNLNVLYEILLVILIVVFLFKSLINLFYKITISEEIITFNTPFNLYRKRLAFTSIEDFRFKTEKTQDDTLVFFLKTGEITSVGVKRYSLKQKRELAAIIEEKAQL